MSDTASVSLTALVSPSSRNPFRSPCARDRKSECHRCSAPNATLLPGPVVETQGIGQAAMGSYKRVIVRDGVTFVAKVDHCWQLLALFLW